MRGRAAHQRDHGRHVPGQVGADDQRDERPAVSKDPLEEGQLHLKAVLGGVGVICRDDGVEAGPKVVGQVGVERDISERRAPRGCGAQPDPVDGDVVRRAEQDDPIDDRRIDGGIGETGRRTRVHVPGVRRDHRHEPPSRGRRPPDRAALSAHRRTRPRAVWGRAHCAGCRLLARLGEVPVHSLGQSIGPARVERPGNRRLTDAARLCHGLPPEPHVLDLLPSGSNLRWTPPGPRPASTHAPQRPSPTPRPSPCPREHHRDPTTSAMRTGRRLRPHFPAGPSKTPAIGVPHPEHRPSS